MKSFNTFLMKIAIFPWWVKCVGLWLVLLILLNCIGLIIVSVVEPGEGLIKCDASDKYSIPGLWARWDSGYYLKIMRSGYIDNPDLWGFFPLYPLICSAISKLTGLNYTFTGMLVAQVSYLIAILLFHQLAMNICRDPVYAMRCIIALVFFPTAFFFYAIYAESLFLVLAVLAILLLLKKEPSWFGSGLAIGLAIITRPVGWLLSLFVGVEFLRQKNFSIKACGRLALCGILSVIGLVLYVLYIHQISGSLTAIPQSIASWGRTWQFPWKTYISSIIIAFTGPRVEGDWFLYVINWVDLFFTTFAVGVAIASVWLTWRKKFPLSLSVYLLGSLVFTLCSEGPHLHEGIDIIPLWGMSRWVTQLFPIYLIIGFWNPKLPYRILAYLSSLILEMFFAAWWLSGRWIG